MSGSFMENNCTNLSGIIYSEPKFSHEIYGEGFYLVTVKVSRLSDTYDFIPVMFSERLIPLEDIQEGRTIVIDGQFRSYNNYNSTSKHKLMLTVFARDIVVSDSLDETRVPNSVFLNGFICKSLFTAQPHSEGKYRIFFLQLTVHTINPIISHASRGEETRVLQAILKSVIISGFGEGSKAGNTRRSCQTEL